MVLPLFREAIASIESAGSGGYGAVGPTHPKLGRALGKYQIMEANIGPWSREALGREVTPDEFIANPQLQDAIFDAKFGSYVQKYGPEGAAQAWFAGPGGVGETGRQDVLGTSVGEYGQKFMSALGAAPPGTGEAALESPQGILPGPTGGILAGAPISRGVAEYYESLGRDNEKGLLGKLSDALQRVPDAPAPRLGPMPDARRYGGLLNEFLEQPGIAQTMLKRRLG